MNDLQKELFANRVLSRLPEVDEGQKGLIKNAILEETKSYVMYTPEEAAEIIKEPLLMLEKFLHVKKYEGLAKSTLSAYKLNVTIFISKVAKPMSDITADDIREYLNNKVVDGTAISTANSHRACLSTFFGWVYDEEYIERNPMRKVKVIKHKMELQPAFSEIEVDALRGVARDNARNLALVDFLLSTGCRVSEICSADINDVNFSDKKVSVIGKGNKKRVVYLTDVAASSLKAYLRHRKDDKDALFVNLRSPHDRMSPRGIQNMLNEIGKEAHIKNVHPHRFRHTCCTRLLCRGMKIQNVSRILGHANINTTMRYNNTAEDYVDSEFRRHSF